LQVSSVVEILASDEYQISLEVNNYLEDRQLRIVIIVIIIVVIVIVIVIVIVVIAIIVIITASSPAT